MNTEYSPITAAFASMIEVQIKRPLYLLEGPHQRASSRRQDALIMLWILFGALLGGVNGQINPPTCNSSLDYQWSFNSLDQNPCVVASFLGQACDTQYSIPSLNTTEHYGGPSTGQDNPCQCSSVMYILLSACGACQGGSFIAWSAYNHNCTNVYPTIFPENIPSGTRVPRWAYQNVTAEDNFNPTEAQAVGDAPESTGSSPSTGTPTTGTSTPTLTPTVSSQGKKTNAGAIAGGVVGGVIVVLLALVALLYLRRMQRRRNEKGATRAEIDVDDKPRPYPVGPVSMSSSAETGTEFHASIPTMSMPSAAMRLYDPSDPSTFPTSILSTSPSPHANHSPQSSETGVTGYFSSAYHSIMPNRQPGLPEL